MPLTISSGTSWPDAISGLACMPSGVPSATALRSTSPVESWGILNRSISRLACVPLPAPGGPRKIRFTVSLRSPWTRKEAPSARCRSGSYVGRGLTHRRTGAPADAGAARTGKAFVMPRNQVAFYLLDGIQRYADDDQERGAAELEGHVVLGDQDAR